MPEQIILLTQLCFDDPDGIRLEIVAKTSARQALELRWNELKEFLNPLQTLPTNEYHIT
ncbi:hypothetical protein COO91_11134 (plasmid) [Nostoc flagelliforme CCNUN1]|uniref:Uncharacterized protein n=1 Tax=Nostoc flagelliforme CCNUN1 TaxID=2038116 RepID=A0A2K8TB55_9NOSO|nr:hypothetical protein [Nostoc flagelliforme]AUB44881.1 hypothetical protein COO91_11134 [Nostoc flagelliforme CCNUN1]